MAAGVPLLTIIAIVRPVVGAAAGLLLYIIALTNSWNMGEFQLYAYAMVLGFSDRALFGFLSDTAHKADITIGKNF